MLSRSIGSRRALVRLATLLAGLAVCYAWFYQGGGWNQNSRFALVQAVTETGSLRIDPYRHHTGDIAFYDDHYYSDKAPGEALTAIPFVEVARQILWGIHLDPGSYAGATVLSYLATFFSEGLGALIAAASLWLVLLDWGSGEDGALFAVLVLGLATPLWCYATMMMGHALAAGMLMASFAAAVRLSRAEQAARQRRLALVAGLAAGWATVTEFPAAIPAAFLALLAIAEIWPRGGVARWRVLLWVTVGALACAGVLMAYNAATFGSPFHIGYESEQHFPGMSQGFFGITVPDAAVLWQLIFGVYRGLIPSAPILAAVPIGLGWLWYRRPDARKGLLVAAAIFIYYLLLNASYDYWDGGWAWGPRHLVPALPFLCLGFGILWAEGRRVGRGVLLVLMAVSLGLTLIAVSTDPQPSAVYKRPMQELLLPAFRTSNLSLNHQTILEDRDPGRPAERLYPYGSWNLGEVAGLRGHVSLWPVVAMWLLVGWIWWRTRERVVSPAPPSPVYRPAGRG
ncbi:MAG TPA: hypothetical protein VIC33_09765 [Vicinamibacterales bacterium]